MVKQVSFTTYPKMDQKNLDQLIQEYQSYLLAKKHLESVKERIEREKRYLNIWELKLKSQERFYHEVKNLSLSGLMYRFLGKQENKIIEEREKYLQATLRYNESVKTLELLQFEEKVLEEKIAAVGPIKTRLNIQLMRREDEIHQHFPLISTVLINIHQKLIRLVSLKQEVKEASELTKIINNKIEHLSGLLDQVINDESWINSLGREGDLPSDSKINELLDEAIDIAFKLKQYYEQLKVELQDLEQFKLELHLNTQKNLQFFKGQFQDQMIADWILDQKLRSVQGSLLVLKKDIVLLKETFAFQERETLDDILAYNNKREELIKSHLSA